MSALADELLEALQSPRGRAILRDALRDAVRSEVERATDALLDVTEAAALLGVTPQALYRRAARGTVPTVRHGGSLRFRRSDLIATEPTR